MSGYLIDEPTTFINIKLTDEGRRLLSLGKLNFSKAVITDREVNYGIDRTGSYDILNNRILAPKDAQPPFYENLDGTAAVSLIGPQIGSVRQIITASTGSFGFFTGTTNTFGIDTTKILGTSRLQYSASTPTGTQEITVLSGGSYFPTGGELIYIPWQTPLNSGATITSYDQSMSANPVVGLWYRVFSANSSTYTIGLDRNTPNFNVATNQQFDIYFYPFDGPEAYYGSSTTVNPTLWNLNIVRTSSEVGKDDNISGYTSYGSIEYNGTKKYLGFSSETRAIGVVHYTNQGTGNTLSEQLQEGSVVVDIPNVMWHKYSASLGAGLTYGLRLYDYADPTIFDNASNTSYRYLRDGVSTTSNVVGRVYHKLKIIVFTDPELLTAISYKSNRNYTLPEPIVGLSTVPKYPLTTSEATGLCQSGKTYFITYITENNSPFVSGTSYGHPQGLHCGYVKKIEGQIDSLGNPQYLTMNFPANSFPYLRNSAGMTTYSGTGWGANRIQMLVNEQNTSSGYDIDTVPSDEWKRVSTTYGNGIYSGDTGDLTIDALRVNGYQFVVSREDYTSGSTYTLNSNFYSRADESLSGLTFGSEDFFFGSINANILATVYKSIITVYAPDTNFNSSQNMSFDYSLDTNTYITEVGILDADDNFVAVGKFTRPIKKNSGRYLAFQLELDF